MRHAHEPEPAMPIAHSEAGGQGDEAAAVEAAPARVGVVIVGHAHTASQLLAAARAIAPTGALDDVRTVDAGEGHTPVLEATLTTVIERVDRGQGVVMIVDLFGASPCTCGLRERAEHELVVLSGLNLAMLIKLATLDRAELSPAEVAQACADSGARAVRIDEPKAAAPQGGDDGR